MNGRFLLYLFTDEEFIDVRRQVFYTAGSLMYEYLKP